MINYLIGDLFTNPFLYCEDNVVIAHIVNNDGKWGAGFTKALNKFSPKPREVYLAGGKKVLGTHEVVDVGNVAVVNMVAQNGVRQYYSDQVVNYVALEICLKELDKIAAGKILLMPKIGCGLGGGDFKIIQPMIEKTLISPEEIYVYRL